MVTASLNVSTSHKVSEGMSAEEGVHKLLELITGLTDRFQDEHLLGFFATLSDEQLALVIQHRLVVRNGAIDAAVQFLLYQRPNRSENDLYIGMLRRFFARHVKNLHDVDDLVQVVALKLTNMRTYTGRTRFPHYLFGIAKKTLARWVASEQRTAALPLLADTPASSIDFADAESSGKQLSRALEALHCLPSEEVCQLLIGYFKGEGDDELARRFGLKKTDVQKKRSGALERIQRQVMREDWLQDHKNHIDLSKLSPRQRAVVAARLNGLSYQQIADRNGLERREAWEGLYAGVGHVMQSWMHSNAGAVAAHRHHLSNQQYEAYMACLQGAKTKEIADDLRVHQLTASRFCDEAIIILSRFASGT